MTPLLVSIIMMEVVHFMDTWLVVPSSPFRVSTLRTFLHYLVIAMVIVVLICRLFIQAVSVVVWVLVATIISFVLVRTVVVRSLILLMIHVVVNDITLLLLLWLCIVDILEVVQVGVSACINMDEADQCD